MERLTKDDLKKVCYDPWEICGMDKHCTKGCFEEGGCTGGCHILKMHLKLAKYEDAEENGLLIRLPCRVGDTVYFLWRCSDETTIVCPATVKEICIGTYMLRKTIKYKIEPKGNRGMTKIFYSSDWGDIVFTTGEAAEQALKMGE